MLCFEDGIFPKESLATADMAMNFNHSTISGLFYVFTGFNEFTMFFAGASAVTFVQLTGGMAILPVLPYIWLKKTHAFPHTVAGDSVLQVRSETNCSQSII